MIAPWNPPPRTTPPPAPRPSRPPRCARRSRPRPPSAPTARRCGSRTPTTSAATASTRRSCERRAAAFAALGIGRGDTVGFMLVNRPALHLFDCAAMHLGATCFSIYNTSSPEQIEYLVGDAANRVVVTEQAFLDRVLEARERVDTLEHVVVIDADEARGPDDRRAVRGAGRRRLRLRGRLARGRARRRALPDLHLGHHRAAQGRPADPRQHDGRVAGARPGRPDHSRRALDLVPAERPRGRPLGAAVLEHGLRPDRPLLPQPARHGGLLDRGEAHALGRRAADLGEAQAGARGGLRRRAGRGEEGRGGRCDEGRAWSAPRPSRRARCPTSWSSPGSQADEQVFSKIRAMLGLDECEWFAVGRRPHPARGDPVLRRDGHRDRRAVGDVGDLRGRHAQPARQDPRGHGRAADPRRGAEAGRGRRDPGARPERS